MTLALSLRELVERNFVAFNEISEVSWKAKPHAGKWSKQEILGHLIDSAYNNHPRIIKASTSEVHEFKGYAQEYWVTINNYQSRDIDEMILTWKLVNMHMSYLIENMSAYRLQKELKNHNFDQIMMRPFGKNQIANLHYLIEDYIFHMQHHSKQILNE